MRTKLESGKLQTTWFERHRAAPLPAPHPGWPQDYQILVLHRMEVIATNPNVALIEQPEYQAAGHGALGRSARRALRPGPSTASNPTSISTAG